MFQINILSSMYCVCNPIIINSSCVPSYNTYNQKILILTLEIGENERVESGKGWPLAY